MVCKGWPQGLGIGCCRTRRVSLYLLGVLVPCRWAPLKRDRSLSAQLSKEQQDK